MGKGGKRLKGGSGTEPTCNEDDEILAKQQSSSSSSEEDTQSQIKEQRERKVPSKPRLRQENETDKYAIYKVPGYSRKYPENSMKSEYIVFLSHTDEALPFSDKDRLALSKSLREYCVSGVVHLRAINRFKVGVTFDLSNNANVFLQNVKLLKELSLKASIPAGDTEVTGVLTSVPTELSNQKISSLIGSSRNVIQVRRFMRRIKDGNGVPTLLPTQTVAVTFASTQLPEYVCLDHWRHEVNLYIPPVKQCLKCLRYGHIAKFCRNTEICSICTENHNFKECPADKTNPKCANCQGNHVGISSSCPIKKQKIEENKIKSKAAKYSDLFYDKNFPQINSNTIETQINNLMKSDLFMNIITNTISQLLLNKTKDKNLAINTVSIRECIQQNLCKKDSKSK